MTKRNFRIIKRTNLNAKNISQNKNGNQLETIRVLFNCDTRRHSDKDSNRDIDNTNDDTTVDINSNNSNIKRCLPTISSMQIENRSRKKSCFALKKLDGAANRNQLPGKSQSFFCLNCCRVFSDELKRSFFCKGGLVPIRFVPFRSVSFRRHLVSNPTRKMDPVER